MGHYIRSARGVMVDMQLLAIKAQLAAQPVPPNVEERKRALDAKNGVKTDAKPDLEFMAVAVAGAQQAENAAAVEKAAVKAPRKATQATQRK